MGFACSHVRASTIAARTREREKEGEKGRENERVRERKGARGPPREKEGDTEERQNATEGKRERGTREGTLVRGPKVPEPILPSYLNSNSKYRRGLLTYCLFRLDRGDSERG